MEKLPIGASALPEPLKSIAQNLDPQMIEKLISSYDPATMSIMIKSMFSMFKDSLSPEQNEALQQVIDNLLQVLAQKGK